MHTRTVSGEHASGTKSVLSGVISNKGYDLSKEAALKSDVDLETAQKRVRELLLELDRYQQFVRGSVRIGTLVYHYTCAAVCGNMCHISFVQSVLCVANASVV
jgi:hypothetical protein